ncbi:MAG: TetR/AcrR family transcriptional regulator [Cyclobacteriaceae bacterium]
MEAKQKILGIAEDMFAEKGINNSHLQDIASRAGISKKTIYKHFENKNDLVVGVLSGLAFRLNTAINEIKDSNLNTPYKLAHLIFIVKNNVKIVTPVFVNDIMATMYDQAKNLVDNYVRFSVFERFKSLLEEGVEEGTVMPNMSVEAVVVLYKDAIMNFLTLSVEQNVPEGFLEVPPVQNFVRSLIPIFRGVLSQKGTEYFKEALIELNLAE